ncbi:hypothetical protein, partial [Streptococcus pneumoniae]|uniref:hypothetical protein n=1 Tax=Streptococcus pneumoniae TaxID=1313 RepID=UPI0018B0E2F2
LSDIMHTLDFMSKNAGQNVGGANPIIIKNAGTRVSDFITQLNFSTGTTATYANNGSVTITSSGGGGFLAATGALNQGVFT